MADIVDKNTRSRMMSGIRGTDTRPEILIRSLLHRKGFRFRLHVKDMPGKPDIVLPRFKAVVFVNGCFWHGHQCSLFKMPSTRTDFWRTKFLKNQENDIVTRKKLQTLGWRVATVWECAIKGKNRIDPNVLIEQLTKWLSNNLSNIELPAKRRKC